MHPRLYSTTSVCATKSSSRWCDAGTHKCERRTPHADKIVHSRRNARVRRDAGEKVTLNFELAIPNIRGKSLIAVVVDYPPEGASPPHVHAKPAFIPP